MATLKSLVDETTNIKNELVECYSNLKNTLIDKQISVDEGEGICSLIDKVNDIPRAKLVTPSNEVIQSFDYKQTVYPTINIDYKAVLDGCYRVESAFNGDTKTNISNLCHIRGGNVISELGEQSTSATLSKDFDGVVFGDILRVTLRGTNSSYTSSGKRNLVVRGTIL